MQPVEDGIGQGVGEVHEIFAERYDGTERQRLGGSWWRLIPFMNSGYGGYSLPLNRFRIKTINIA